VQNFELRAPVEKLQVQNFESGRRQIISGKALQCQVKKFCVEPPSAFRYNIYINRKERLMSDNDFFKLNQEQWFQEFTETELPKNFSNTDAHSEKFEFDDVPF
jgi:hypothetical protein